MKTALITGVGGQDGCYLSKHLLSQGYKVVGGTHKKDHENTWRLNSEGLMDSIEFIDMDLGDQEQICQVIKKYHPEELYNLGAQSLIGRSFEVPHYTTRVNSEAVVTILETIRNESPQTRFYQASSSELFGNTQEWPQSEKTPFSPRNPYGVSKQFAHWMTGVYRQNHGIHGSCGIIYNHESPYRGVEFVTGKICHGMAKIKMGRQETLQLGNMESQRDWGFAGDYVRAMHLILQQETPDDYVISSGKPHSVREFVQAAADVLEMSLEWEGEGLGQRAIDKNSGNVVVSVNPQFFRKNEDGKLVGDSAKARARLGWEPEVSFEELVHMMVRAEIERIENSK